VKRIKNSLIVFFLLLNILLFSVDSTFLTYTVAGNNIWKVTQDAYIVSEVLFRDYNLYYPEDLFIKGSKMYIADSGNARIVVYDMETGEATSIGDFKLWQPTGVFVTDEYIYVADPGSSEVVIFNLRGEEVKRIGRPTNPIFGETANYKPKKLVVDKRGNLYIVSEGTFEGIIQLDKDGEFLGYFGSNLVGVTLLDKFIDLFYTKEQKEKFLHRIPKPYANITIDDKGLIYTVTQKEYGNAIKKHNTNGLGKAYFQSARYDKAALHFKEAFARRDYSDAFWEMRNNFLQKNMGIILSLLVIIILIFTIIDLLSRYGKIKIKFHVKNKLLSDVLYIKNILRHPLDTFYYLQKKKHGSVLSASIIYLMFLLVILVDYFGRSFIFNLNTSDRNVGFVLLTSSSILFLWIISNWLVSSINDGKGTLRDIYVFTAYSFAPYILFQPLVILSTYVLTYNEKFLIDFASMFLISWSAVMLFTGVKETHDYDIKNTVKSILFTLGWVFVIILVYSIVYMLWDQLVETAFSIVQEVLYRVRNIR